MKRPRYPTRAQLKTLRAAAQLPAPQSTRLRSGVLTVPIPVNGLVLIEVN
jgi:xylan 1,4-beta-xylosidase